MAVTKTSVLASIIDRKLETTSYRTQHWEGSLLDYLDLVTEDPTIARNAFQRVYDMIVSSASRTRRSSSRK
jgi:serine protein kinase